MWVRVWVVGVKSRKGIEDGDDDVTHRKSPGKQELNAKQKNGGLGIWSVVGRGFY